MSAAPSAPRSAARLCALALAAAALGGCSRDRAEAERLVREYNDASILAYKTGNTDRFREVATEREWRKVVALVDLKKGAGLVLESELQRLEITSVRRPAPDVVEVGTRERWSYHDRAVRPGVPVGPNFVADMSLEYQFVRAEGRWKLDQARTLTNEFVEPKGYALEKQGKGKAHGDEPGEARASGEKVAPQPPPPEARTP